jgi:APA family basic amino acid/polyamine antiporter
LFAQSAWNNVTFTGGEVENPGRNLPRALLIGCGLVVTLYLLANLAYVVVLPLGQFRTPTQIVSPRRQYRAIFGPVGKIIIAVAIMISTFGCNNGLILAGARTTPWRATIYSSSALAPSIQNMFRPSR